MTNEIIGMILSLIAMSANVLSVQMPKKSLLLLLQSVGSILYSIAFFFAGGGIGGIMNVLLLIRNFLFMGFGDRKGKGVSIAFFALSSSYLAALLLYNFVLANGQSIADKIWNTLPVIGGIVGTLAFSLSNLNTLRKVRIGDCGCWLAYNIHVGWGALGGIIGDSLNLISIGIALFRFRDKEEYEQEKVKLRPVRNKKYRM